MAADIRPARATDVDALSAIEKAVFSTDRISASSFRRLVLSPSASVLVSVSGGCVAGYLIVLLRAGSRRARLYSIAAAPGRAGAGLGRALLVAAEKEAATRGAAVLGLEVREDNSRAIDLYEKSGYRRLARVDSYYGDGAAALRYEKRLAGEGLPGAAPVAPEPRPGAAFS